MHAAATAKDMKAILEICKTTVEKLKPLSNLNENDLSQICVILTDIGDVHREAGNHKKAIECYDLALDKVKIALDKVKKKSVLGVVEAYPLASKGTLLDELDDMNGASRCFKEASEKAISGYAAFVKLPTELLHCYYRVGIQCGAFFAENPEFKIDAMRNGLARARTIEEKNPNIIRSQDKGLANFHLGQYCLSNNKEAEAQRYFDLALEQLQPESRSYEIAHVHFFKGISKFVIKQFTSAEEHFRKASELANLKLKNSPYQGMYLILHAMALYLSSKKPDYNKLSKMLEQAKPLCAEKVDSDFCSTTGLSILTKLFSQQRIMETEEQAYLRENRRAFPLFVRVMLENKKPLK